MSLPFSTTVKVAFEQLNNLNKKKITFLFIKQLNSCLSREHPHLFLYTNMLDKKDTESLGAYSKDLFLFPHVELKTCWKALGYVPSEKILLLVNHFVTMCLPMI